MSAVRNRAEERAPAALRPQPAQTHAAPRTAEASADKPASFVAPAPVGSIAAIESQLGF